ncbi:MAG TPA: bifunctional nuclease family protein [Candidatus Omnitrophota bacterium]|nr:bifunctional nuclease family protein [Candidatus Omnitrophota bacterium]HPD84346.1 bifunctional nuclease family protein [Candidatus Omnitrophota bacterium]HRZ03204.1 bifunctional nuclease family protein [Candidatus Omnitrophota bacterium]
MVEVELSRIIIDEKRQDQIIVLKEKNGGRQFPIVIGFLEATSIKMKLSRQQLRRPMTHDLLVLTISGLDAKLEKLVIDKLIDNTFHAKLFILAPDGKTKIIDARPSDGIAVAVRTGAPIFVEEEVMNKAAFIKPQQPD